MYEDEQERGRVWRTPVPEEALIELVGEATVQRCRQRLEHPGETCTISLNASCAGVVIHPTEAFLQLWATPCRDFLAHTRERMLVYSREHPESPIEIELPGSSEPGPH